MKFLFKEGVRKLIILLGQAALVMIAYWSAICLIYDGTVPEDVFDSLASVLPLLVAIKLLSFTIMHMLSGWWRYVSIHDLVTMVKANLLGSLCFAITLELTSISPEYITTSLLVLDGLLCFLLISGTRVAVRLCREYFQTACKICSRNNENVLIVGAGASGQSIVREIQQNPRLKWQVVGFVDQDLRRVKKRFQGVLVLASIDGLENLLRTRSVDLVILANPALSQKELRRIVSLCHEIGVKSKILPNVGEILNGNLSIQHIRDVKLDDLLGRSPVDLDITSIREYLCGKKVLVTGAAGSIGQEICRQVAKFGASQVILFESAETPLFQIDGSLKKQFPEAEFISLLSDVRYDWQVDYAFRKFRPEVVFHAAAYKHVPMSELNPVVAIENNVIGSRNVIDAAVRFQVDRLVMVSTDKAVNPTNIMGASKRAAEIYAQSIAKTSQTRIMTVRFGNVLGSNGSVVPIFQEQIHSGGPVTVTDPAVTRFFMTIPEAVQLVLQAGSMGSGGEIFILNMGEQIHIVRLAEDLIRLSGMIPYKDIDIIFTGLRPGEKLHEELLYDNESLLQTSHEKISVAMACWHDRDVLKRAMEDLTIACHTMDYEKTIKVLLEIVPTFDYVFMAEAGKARRFKILKPKLPDFSGRAAETA